MGDLLVIHHEVAVFSANVIRLSALEKLGLSFKASPSNGPVIIHMFKGSVESLVG